MSQLPVFSDELLQEILQRIDLVQLIGEQVVLRRSGRRYVGLCPFHQEKTPSFSVDPDRGLFYCFGCQTGGTAFTFIQKMEGITFPEAVEQLAERSGVTLPRRDFDYDDSQLRLKRRLYDACAAALDFFQTQLSNHPEGGKARRYTIQRGLETETIKAFQLGYAPPDWRGLAEFLQINGFGLDILEAAGLVVVQSPQTYYDRFRDRLIFPIFDARGRCIAFGGRQLDNDSDQAKYLNSPQSPIFDKSSTLYGLHLLRREKTPELVLYEGYMDLITAWQGDSRHGVASLGTSLTWEHCRLLKRFCNRVILCYDADSSGVSASDRGMFMLQRSGLEVAIARIPAGKDPDDYIRQHGGESYRQEVLARSLPLLRYCKEQLKTSFALDTIEGKSSYAREFLTILAKVASPVEEEEYLHELAADLGLTVESLRRERERISGRSRGSTSLVEAATNAQSGRPFPGNPITSSPGSQGGTGRHLVEQEATAVLRQGSTASFPVQNISPREITKGRERAEEILLALAVSDPLYARKLEQDFLPGQFLPANHRLVETLRQSNSRGETRSVNLALDPEFAAQVARLNHVEGFVDPQLELAYEESAAFLQGELLKEELAVLGERCSVLQETGDDRALGEAVSKMQELQLKLAQLKSSNLI